MAVFALTVKSTQAKFKVNTPSLSLLPLQHKNLLFSCKFNKRYIHAGYIASSSAMACLFPECRHGHPGKTDPCNSRRSCWVGFYQGSGHELAASFYEVWNTQEDLGFRGGGFCWSIILCYWPIVTNIRFYFRKISMVIWACWHQLVFWCGCENKKDSLIKGRKTSKNWTKDEERVYMLQFSSVLQTEAKHWRNLSDVVYIIKIIKKNLDFTVCSIIYWKIKEISW